jgi:acetylornithine aminotransferase
VGGRAKGIFKPGNHGSTFGGNPLAMTALVATIDTIKEERLLENAERVGDLIRAGLGAANLDLTEIRGMGLMIGVELPRACGELVRQALEAGVVINVTAECVIRMLPPLIMKESEGREVVARLAPVIKSFLEARAMA